MGKVDAYRKSLEARSSYRTQTVPNCSEKAYSGSLECKAIQLLEGYYNDHVLDDVFKESLDDFNRYQANYQNGTLRYSSNRDLATLGHFSDLKIRQNSQYATAKRKREDEAALAPLAAVILGGMAAYVLLGEPNPNNPPAWTPDTKMHTFGYSANDLMLGSPSTF